jgi:hypothetical protein
LETEIDEMYGGIGGTVGGREAEAKWVRKRLRRR